MGNLNHSLRLLVWLVAISGLLIGLVYWLFALYRDRPARSANWLRTLETSPEELGGFSYRSLALISLLSLFLEMLMIRWISSEIRIFAYFKNLVLVACFLGFGLGCYLCRRRVQLGSNLFGSLAGGLLESLSLWFGLKSLIVLAALIYAGSVLALLWPARTAPGGGSPSSGFL
jgi:hypothetical protein